MKSRSHQSLFGRAFLALLLTIGFYGLALAIAFGLLYLIYLEVAVLGRINVRLTFFALVGAVVILWAIFPRIDKFTAPGPRLTPARFPALFKEIEKIAHATRQEMPREVYLIPDVNAFVAERGGFMGIGSRRVMGIGLPLFHLMTVSELSSVLAHEFGHFYGGDTALGPWIYKTRAAIIRTVVSLGSTNQWLQIPFEAYAKMFLRITNAVSRQQEFTADQLAARTVGAQATIMGLQKVHRYGLAFDSFFRQEYIPLLEAGYRPPMLAGFDLFLKSPRISEAVNNYYTEQETQGQSDPYDTHPSLKERLAALQGLPPGVVLDGCEAFSLLPTSVDQFEDLILKGMVTKKEIFKNLKLIRWDEAVQYAFLPHWQKTAETYKTILNKLTPAMLFETAQNFQGLFENVARIGNFLPANVQPAQVPAEKQLEVTSNLIGSALASALDREGWKVSANPGEVVTCIQGTKELQPFLLFSQLATRQTSAEQWQKICEENQISDLAMA
ncbi:MAG TPA: M48 family metallopeptidase [Anaerolineales bacterium]|nr:M48 family metallopeptidase [Anaerolineales bacterium]